MAVTAVPDSISEEYYQINEAILDSFSKYRLPLDLFVFNYDAGQLLTYSRKDTRFSNEQVEEIRQLCSEGDLFVSRADHPIYSRHIAKQLDLVLVDQNLKETEVADISIRALESRLDEFFAQPVKPLFEKLYADVQVITEYLWTDMHRLRLFVRRLHTGDHSLVRHSINTFSVGLWLYMLSAPEETHRKDFDQAAMALLLHDVGMAKISGFITGKTTPLKPEEKEKIQAHILAGYKIMHKLDQSHDVMRQSTLEHHERLDGSGYPQHSKDISQFGRLTAVADAFSAMVQKRPYAEAKTLDAAARELTAARNKFDLSMSGKILTALVSDTFGKVR
ncbi:MAG: HD domain-containing protein [Desulfovibrio sp.]|jgi:HD-GYP domain-containing protein (c-di-GMP phosphodiesterase class II)|nr:HD domain-containing protein [Desulfovibrio sp.]